MEILLQILQILLLRCSGCTGFLGELLYAYVTCRPDIGYAVTTLAKFSTHPHEIHYKYLKGIATYLRRTRKWGIRYEMDLSSGPPSIDLPNGDFSDLPHPLPPELPPFPILPKGPVIICFCDAAYGNVKSKGKSTTGYSIHLGGGAIVYRSKTQTQTALSSTEAEFYAAISAAKIVRYIRFILQDLQFPQHLPTIIYEDNASTKKIVEAAAPTERSRHISIPHFAMLDWQSEGSITMAFIPGKLNPSDALTKPLGWILHNRHARRLMGHFTGISPATEEDNLQSNDHRLGEGVSGANTPETRNPNRDACHL